MNEWSDVSGTANQTTGPLRRLISVAFMLSLNKLQVRASHYETLQNKA
jgi:hypothetical protein